jgi:hypothetical protein
VTRLDSPDAGVRRVAIHDLIAQSRTDPQANRLMLDRLPKERDEKAALLLVRHLAGVREAMPALLGLYLDRGTPVRVAHAAILAHDAMAGELRIGA